MASTESMGCAAPVRHRICLHALRKRGGEGGGGGGGEGEGGRAAGARPGEPRVAHKTRILVSCMCAAEGTRGRRGPASRAPQRGFPPPSGYFLRLASRARARGDRRVMEVCTGLYSSTAPYSTRAGTHARTQWKCSQTQRKRRKGLSLPRPLAGWRAMAMATGGDRLLTAIHDIQSDGRCCVLRSRLLTPRRTSGPSTIREAPGIAPEKPGNCGTSPLSFAAQPQRKRMTVGKGVPGRERRMQCAASSVGL